MGSLLSHRATATVPIPFAPPHEVTVQKLAGRHVERAREEAQIAWQKQVERKGGIQKQKELLKAFKDDEPTDPSPAKPKPEAAPDPLAGMDQYTLCRFGVTAITSDDSLDEEEVVDEDGNKVMRIKLFYEASEDELEWYATQVMKVTNPKLFQTKDERQESEKKDSAASLTL